MAYESRSTLALNVITKVCSVGVFASSLGRFASLGTGGFQVESGSFRDKKPRHAHAAQRRENAGIRNFHSKPAIVGFES